MESRVSETIKADLIQRGWFKKLSDRYQVGLPDIIGCMHGKFIGIEVKSVAEIAPEGLCPRMSEHTFSPKQVRELTRINEAGGLGIAVVACKDKLMYFHPHLINEHGQVNANNALVVGHYVNKEKGRWDMGKILEYFNNIGER